MPTISSQRNIPKSIITIMCVMVLLSVHTTANARPITLAEAESMAIKLAPELKQLEAKQQVFEQQSIFEGQLSDPKLLLGAKNLPVDTFDLGQEAMTQMQVGLQQSFPHGREGKVRLVFL